MKITNVSKYLFLVLLSIVTTVPVFACDMNSVAEMIANQTKSASFLQTKNLPALASPLVSSGLLYRSASNDLVWQIQRPLKSTMVIRSDRILQFNRNDMLIQTLTDPVVAEISSVFQSLFGGELAELESVFNEELDCYESGWVLTLLPVNESMGSLFSYIRIQEMETNIIVEYEETRGDETHLVFSKVELVETQSLETYLEN